MLIKVTVDNFLSFDKETSLTMIPSNKTRKIRSHKVNIKGIKVLKYGAIYGANAAGKSNLVKIFSFIKRCLNNPLSAESANCFCKTEKENTDRPSLFELQFSIGNKFYAYGFTAVLKSCIVKTEWLYELNKNGSQKILFERETGKKPILGDNNLNDTDSSKWETYVGDFDDNSNELFLTVMNRGKKYADDSKLQFFKMVYDWLNNNIIVVTPNIALRNFEYYCDEASLSKITELIKIFDTGISEVNLEEITIEQLRNEVPEFIYNEMLKTIKTASEVNSKPQIDMTMRSEYSFFGLHFIPGSEPVITTISIKHGQSFYNFKYKEESDGTRRLFELIDMLLNRADDTVYIIDEIERSLHPKLLAKFIEIFDAIHKNQKMQLLFTTHESTIMDQHLFRRDEFWFVERDYQNNSIIYSLDKFKERYDKKLSKAYLEGRYGAIPVFSLFDFKKE